MRPSSLRSPYPPPLSPHCRRSLRPKGEDDTTTPDTSATPEPSASPPPLPTEPFRLDAQLQHYICAGAVPFRFTVDKLGSRADDFIRVADASGGSTRVAVGAIIELSESCRVKLEATGRTLTFFRPIQIHGVTMLKFVLPAALAIAAAQAASACEDRVTIDPMQARELLSTIANGGADPLDQFFAFDTLMCADQTGIRDLALRTGGRVVECHHQGSGAAAQPVRDGNHRRATVAGRRVEHRALQGH